MVILLQYFWSLEYAKKIFNVWIQFAFSNLSHIVGIFYFLYWYLKSLRTLFWCIQVHMELVFTVFHISTLFLGFCVNVKLVLSITEAGHAYWYTNCVKKNLQKSRFEVFYHQIIKYCPFSAVNIFEKIPRYLHQLFCVWWLWSPYLKFEHWRSNQVFRDSNEHCKIQI